jgi:hypothetical protein
MVRVDIEKLKKETVMEQEMYITLPYSLAISNVKWQDLTIFLKYRIR